MVKKQKTCSHTTQMFTCIYTHTHTLLWVKAAKHTDTAVHLFSPQLQSGSAAESPLIAGMTIGHI